MLVKCSLPPLSAEQPYLMNHVQQVLFRKAKSLAMLLLLLTMCLEVGILMSMQVLLLSMILLFGSRPHTAPLRFTVEILPILTHKVVPYLSSLGMVSTQIVEKEDVFVFLLVMALW